MSAVTGTFDSTTPNKTADDAQPECTTTIPDKYGWVPLGSCNSYYFSVPDFNSAVAFALLFGVFTIVQLFQAFVFRRVRIPPYPAAKASSICAILSGDHEIDIQFQRYCWVLIMGGIWETTSFAPRAVGQRNQQSQVISTLSTLLLLLFPLWINAFAYMTAGRLIHCFSPTHAALGIRAIKIGRIFVWCDIFSFIVQIIGGLLLMPGNNVDSIRLGLKIYMGGVGLQQLSILGFSALIWRFHWKKKNGERVYSTIYKDEGDRERDRRGKWSLYRRWEVLVWALYAVLALITVGLLGLRTRLKTDSPTTDPDYIPPCRIRWRVRTDKQGPLQRELPPVSRRVADAAGRTGADTHTSWGCIAGTRFFISKEAALVDLGSETRVQACYKGAEDWERAAELHARERANEIVIQDSLVGRQIFKEPRHRSDLVNSRWSWFRRDA